MTSFKLAYNNSRRNEGGYANDPRDKGKETYKGVSRVHNPLWAGWLIVDAYKKAHGAIKNNFVIPDTKLDNLVIGLFKTNYWDKIKGDSIKSQLIANIMFDFALTSGYARSAINAQENAGVTADGLIGSDSLRAINGANEKELASKILQSNEDYYKYLANEHPEKESYAWALPSWMNRINYFKEAVNKLPAVIGGGAIALIGLSIGLFFLMNHSKSS